MELEKLKSSWQALDCRLDDIDRRLDALASAVASGRIVSSLDRLRRINRLLFFPLAMLPLFFASLFRHIQPSTALSVSFGTFLLAMVARQILLVVLLDRIRPERQTVREMCLAVLRLRRCFLWGVAAGIGLAVPLLCLLAWHLAQFVDAAPLLWGFAAGIVCGVGIGIRMFLRINSEIDALRSALDEA